VSIADRDSRITTDLSGKPDVADLDMENQKALHEEHSELMHYTGAAGLYGIVAGKTLWASHTAFLNDSEEVVGFLDRRLPMILKPKLERHVAESAELTAMVKAASQQGCDLLDQQLKMFCAGFKKAQEETQDHYVTSFCTASDGWVSQNGLLSQWRGYGSGGGYAIVFDTKGLGFLLANDAEIYRDSEETLVFGNVQYDEGGEEVLFAHDEQLQQHVQRVQDEFVTCLGGRKCWEDYGAFDSVALLSAFWKHRGFQEEKEVRIVVGEPSPKIQLEIAGQVTTPFRKIHSFSRNGAAVPCIHLFEDQKLNDFPILRVIVGPHPDKKERRKSVEILLRNHGIDSEVLVSDTPFRGE
jgi:Protein of unknown function (DUF2971)